MSDFRWQAAAKTSIRTCWILGIGCGLISAVLGGLSITDLWKPWWDSAIYMDLARSILVRGDYTYQGEPHTKYPPGFPLLLSGVIGSFGWNHAILKAIGVASWVGMTCLTPFLFLRRLPPIWLFSLTLLVSVSPVCLFFGTYVLSDLPFTVLTLLCVLILSGRNREEPLSRQRLVWGGALLLVSCTFRLAGVTLIAAWILSSLGSRRHGSAFLQRLKVSLLVALPAIVFLVGWGIRGMGNESVTTHGLREGVSYVQEFFVEDAETSGSSAAGVSGMASRLLDNIPYYAGLVGSVLRGSNHVAQDPLRSGLSSLVVLGLLFSLISAKNRWGLLEWYLIFSLLLCLFWPAREDLRFLVPLVPLLIGYSFLGCFEGMERLASRFLPARKGRAPLDVLGILFGVVPAVFGLFEDRTLIGYHREETYMTAGVEELRAISMILKTTPAETRVVSDLAPWVHFWSQRKTYSYPGSSNPEVVYQGLMELRADYVVFTSLNAPNVPNLLGALQAHPESFEVAHSEGKSVLVRVIGW